MKYNFVFDKDFLGNKTFALSNKERFIVLSAVIGGHNVALSGYHTDRLVEAIKLLRDKNTPFISVDSVIGYRKLIGESSDRGLKHGFVTDADGGTLHFSDLDSQDAVVASWLTTVMKNGWIKLCNNGYVTLPAKFQLIAENCVDSVAKEYCDIIFRCNEDDPRQLWTFTELQRQIKMAERNQHLRNDTGIKNRDIKDANDLKLSSNASDMVSEQLIKLDTLRLARTVADIYGHRLTFCSDIEMAKDFQTNGVYSL